jgi:acyl-coenzyme A thioesterase PaaI-like protein
MGESGGFRDASGTVHGGVLATQPGRIVAQAELRKRGKRLSVVEADLTQEETGDIVAHAVGTFSLTS